MTRRAGPRELPERDETPRAALKRVLAEGLFTAHDLSVRVGISEKDVAGHLEHLDRSLRRGEMRLLVEPAGCRGCGFVFEDRSRMGKPSRCPRCKSERLTPARYGLVPARQ